MSPDVSTLESGEDIRALKSKEDITALEIKPRYHDTRN